jgi:integrase
MIAASPDIATFLETVYLPAHFLGDNSARQLMIVGRQFSEWSGPTPVSDVTEEMVVAFMRHCRNLGNSPATINTKRRGLLTILTFAWKKRYTQELLRDVPKVPEPERIPEAWTIEEVERLLATSARLPGLVGNSRASAWWPALELLLYWTGARIGDVMAATPDSWDANHYEWRCIAAKTGKEHFYLLPQSCILMVAKIFDRTANRLFVWPHSPNHLFVTFRKIVETAGIRYTGRHNELFYRLRRTNLTYCYAADPGIAQRQADHSSLRVTRRHYVDPRIAVERSAVDVLPVPMLAGSQRMLF